MPAKRVVTNTKIETRLPVRGSRCRDWWDADDAHELAGIRQTVAAFDVRTAVIAVDLQREQRQERKRRERERQRQRRQSR
jgi:hypothetical protein